ncbi:MAG TPA: GxxExxY protein [Ktedonobacterales bacterium]|nr:GxxExxY protein [Ktedonobacterales bacterium]
MDERELSQVSNAIIGAAMRVHSALGPGLLESAYEACLALELTERGMQVERQKPLPVTYRGMQVECGFRLDMLVEDAVVVELKAVEALTSVHHAQLLSYLKLSGYKLGLLINFHVTSLRQGIKRVVNNL